MHIKKQGFSLTEIMIALVINGILFLALFGIFTSNLNHYHKTNDINMLNEQLQEVMQTMERQIRRAGYWANAQNDVGNDTNNNPFMAAGTDISITGNCILFSYDRNNDGALPTLSSSYDDERYGFRLNNGVVQARPFGAAYSCAAAATAWDDITDSNLITITALTFTLNQQTVTSNNSSLLIRSVDIVLTGRLVNDNTITKTLTEHVRLRNDKFIP